MRIALFTIDSLASNRAVRAFIQAHNAEISLVGLSCRPGPGLLREAWRHFLHSGIHFCVFMFLNFVLPRWVGLVGALRRRFGLAHRQTTAELCTAFGIACVPVPDVNSPQTQHLLHEQSIDLVVSCYFDQIFSAATIAIPQLGIVNVHTALLPGHRGPMPVLYGWLNQPPSLGVTLHRVDESIDTGPILAQESYTAPPGETILHAMTELHQRGLDLLGDRLAQLEHACLPGEQQGEGSYERFPSRAVMRAFRRRGGRLVDARDLRRAMTTPVDY